MKAEQQTILVVDDDHGIRDLLGQFLQKHGYQTVLASDGNGMREALQTHTVQMIILDIMMPGEDGLTLCRELRTKSNIPIVMLTAIGEDVDRILGLEMGADDYIAKPFNPRELLARAKAILRRSQMIENDAQVDSMSKRKSYCFSGWKLDKVVRCLTSPDGLEIILSTGEFNLLVALVENPQQVLSRDQLLEITKNREAAPFDRSIDIQISRLRNKMEEDPKRPVLIKTIRGGGYILTAPVEQC